MTRFVNRLHLTEHERQVVAEAQEILVDAARTMIERLKAKGFNGIDCHIGFGWVGYDTCIRAQTDWLKERKDRRLLFEQENQPVAEMIEAAFAAIDNVPTPIAWTPELVAKTLGIEPTTDSSKEAA